MNWKFWKKKGGNDTSKPKVIKLPKPKNLPERVRIYLITRLRENPDWIWNLKWVVRHKLGEKNLLEFRIFSPADAMLKSVDVTDFSSLNDHPEMVLFDGLFDKNSGIVQIKKTKKAA